MAGMHNRSVDIALDLLVAVPGGEQKGGEIMARTRVAERGRLGPGCWESHVRGGGCSFAFALFDQVLFSAEPSSSSHIFSLLPPVYSSHPASFASRSRAAPSATMMARQLDRQTLECMRRADLQRLCKVRHTVPAALPRLDRSYRRIMASKQTSKQRHSSISFSTRCSHNRVAPSLPNLHPSNLDAHRPCELLAGHQLAPGIGEHPPALSSYTTQMTRRNRLRNLRPGRLFRSHGQLPPPLNRPLDPSRPWPRTLHLSRSLDKRNTDWVLAVQNWQAAMDPAQSRSQPV